MYIENLLYCRCGVPQLKLQERLQEKQGLLTKKEELAAIIQKEERDIKVKVYTEVEYTEIVHCSLSTVVSEGRCQPSATDRWRRSCGGRRWRRESCVRLRTRPRQSARQRWTASDPA